MLLFEEMSVEAMGRSVLETVQYLAGSWCCQLTNPSARCAGRFPGGRPRSQSADSPLCRLHSKPTTSLAASHCPTAHKQCPLVADSAVTVHAASFEVSGAIAVRAGIR